MSQPDPKFPENGNSRILHGSQSASPTRAFEECFRPYFTRQEDLNSKAICTLLADLHWGQADPGWAPPSRSLPRSRAAPWNPDPQWEGKASNRSQRSGVVNSPTPAPRLEQAANRVRAGSPPRRGLRWPWAPNADHCEAWPFGIHTWMTRCFSLLSTNLAGLGFIASASVAAAWASREPRASPRLPAANAGPASPRNAPQAGLARAVPLRSFVWRVRKKNYRKHTEKTWKQ